MNSQFRNCVLLIFMFLSSSCLGQEGPSTRALIPEIHISVYDYVGVPNKLMAAAEAEVHRIFQQAGVEVLWRNCFEGVENIQPPSCHAVGSSYFVLKILPHAMSPQVRDRIDVLGTAALDDKGVGFYGYAFYDQIQQLADARRLTSALLGHVIAHEIGHLLLQSNSHSITGIMSGRWAGGELRRISEGAMFFMPNESKMMRDRLSTVALKAADSPRPFVTKTSTSLIRGSTK
jgi:hypothetical protein